MASRGGETRSALRQTGGSMSVISGNGNQEPNRKYFPKVNKIRIIHKTTD
jgi:hypothetical protein